ncbi:hypothetical protein RB620_16745 [Paenibacillus sp. LHD-117]|uniref:hypothetical protein n=1 Tax=Paenibacillus sp. LHD-117 TaxID=3071412 RepID=UPI0027E21306|nr:hypothetical protein [Paenibacillus sp. LHD-117]MDQ6421078.1 hypothetical protein [Paenibacillus sp. LHD-117]
MVWTAIWFIMNMLFVASLIAFLFMHRSHAMAAQQGEGAGRILLLKRRKLIAGVVSAVFFAAMCASFLINMRLNG